MLLQQTRMRYAFTLILVIATVLSACRPSTSPDATAKPENSPRQQTPVDEPAPTPGVTYPSFESDHGLTPYLGLDESVPPASRPYPIESTASQPTPYPPFEAVQPTATLPVATTEPAQPTAGEQPVVTAIPVTILPTAIAVPGNPTAQRQLDDKAVPVAIVSFKNKTLRFDCVNDAHCPDAIDLTGVLPISEVVEWYRAWYWSSESIFMIFNDGWTQTFILHINQQTGQNKITRLPSDKPYFMADSIDGQLAFLNPKVPEVIFYDQDLNVERVQIDLQDAWFSLHMLGASDHRLAVWNELPMKIGDEYYFGYSVIDTRTKQASVRKVRFQSPRTTEQGEGKKPEQNDLLFISGISSDLQSIYCTYQTTDDPQNVLFGVFALDRLGDELVAEGAVVNLRGSDKYRDMSLRHGGRSTVYDDSASLFNMATGKSLLPGLPEINRFDRVIFRGFGDSILAGTLDAIYQITFDGELIQRYELPPQWVGQDYFLMEYINPY